MLVLWSRRQVHLLATLLLQVYIEAVMQVHAFLNCTTDRAQENVPAIDGINHLI